MLWGRRQAKWAAQLQQNQTQSECALPMCDPFQETCIQYETFLFSYFC